MKILSLIAFFTVSLAFGQTLESFSYTGALNASNWVTHSGTPGQMVTLTTPASSGNSLSYTGLAASAGNRAVMSNDSTEDVNYALGNITGNIGFFSFILNVKNTNGLTTGNYFFGFGATAGGTLTVMHARLFVKAGVTANTIQLGIANSGTTVSYDPTEYPINTNIFVVVRYDKTATPATASLFVNPTPGGTQPTANATNNSSTSVLATFASLFIRQSSGIANAEIDEIRAHDTWAGVTPAGSTGCATSSNLTVTNCGPYTLNGQTYTSSGNYTQTLVNGNSAGCDSTINLALTIGGGTTTNTLNINTCAPYTVPSGDETYNVSGTYTDTIPNSGGCDSLITINLTVNSPSASSVSLSGCDSVTLNGQSYFGSGIFTQTLTNAAGCDSVITINATVSMTPGMPTASPDVTICDTMPMPTLSVSASALPSLVITGVFDGPLPGGQPKVVELYAINAIPDLSIYGLGSANNGGGTDGVEFTFPNDAVAAGSYITVTTSQTDFQAYFGTLATYEDNQTNSSVAINGDDAVELFKNSVVIDVFGEINVDGTGTAWDYLDGWAYRINNSQANNGVWNIGEWIFSGINATDGATSNATATSVFPIGTFVSAPLANNFVWYSDATLSTQVGTGMTFTPQSILPSNTATFYVTNSNGNCTSPADMVTITIDCFAGIDELNTSNISIYPNPSATGIFTWSNDSFSSMKITIMDMMGRILTTYSSDTTEGIIDLSNTANGTYFVLFENQNGFSKARLIKQ